MKNVVKFLIFGCLLISAGCVTSLNPLYTEQDLIFNPSLAGVWSEKDSVEKWEFRPSGEKSYRIIYTDENGKKGEFVGHLLKIEAKIFLDLMPAEKFTQNDFYKDHFLPTHSFALLKQIDTTTVQISFLEIRWLKKILAADPSALKHTEIDDGVLLTASPQEMQKFLLENLDAGGAFVQPLELKRQK